MKISVFGLGYVGAVSAACLAARGNEVVGVDISEDKVALVNSGRSPLVEEHIGDLMARVVADGSLRATMDVDSAVSTTELSLVCVGTPSAPNGSLSTLYLERVAEQIGEALGRIGHRHTVVFRSTMLPGTCMGTLVPILERCSGRRAGLDFGVAFNPEYLREGSSVRDFHNPAKTVIGEIDTASGDAVATLYQGLPGVVLRIPIEVAEMSKYTDNAFHALKIGFANEIGAICQALGLDSHEVMDVFLTDHKLNVSAAYLRPGFAFGGSCLPKDLRGLLYAAHRADVSVPILEHVLPSNEEQIRRAMTAVTESGHRRVGLFGLAFKPGTDDLRESPLLELAERLLGKGYDIRIYDSAVSVAKLVGANRAYLEQRLPHLGELLTGSVEEVLEHAEVCVVGTRDEEAVRALSGATDKLVIDLVRLPDAGLRRLQKGYVGLGW